MVDGYSQDLFFYRSLAAALADSVGCCAQPKQPSLAEPSVLDCGAKAALTNFSAGLADYEGRCSMRAGADNVPEADATIVAAFFTFTGSPFLTPKKLRADSLSSCSSPSRSSFDQS